MQTPSPDDPVELGIWVLDRGLPPLPLVLTIGETVPVARWSGQEYGALRFVNLYLDDEEGESSVDANVQTGEAADALVGHDRPHELRVDPLAVRVGRFG